MPPEDDTTPAAAPPHDVVPATTIPSPAPSERPARSSGKSGGGARKSAAGAKKSSSGARKAAGAAPKAAGPARRSRAEARRPSSRRDVLTVTSDQGGLLPNGFRFGVATAGFQIEGGFNGPGEPANNWVRWERVGRVEPSGVAADFWNRYEEYLDRTVDIGCDAFRLGVEWARVETRPGEFDDEALDRYAAILAACGERGLEPLVTLHRFTHPAWLGEDFWLSREAPGRYAAWVDVAVRRLGGSCRHWVTLNEINALALGSYLIGIFPPGRSWAFADMATASDHMLAAHVRAYEIIHGLQADATVTTNNVALSLYELDRMLVDVLMARSLGVARAELHRWLEERRSAWYSGVAPPSPLERLLRRVSTRRAMSAAMLPAAIEAVWSSPFERTLDVTGIDYYDPVVARHARPPGHVTAGGRSWRAGRQLWDDKVDPSGLVTYLRSYRTGDLPLWVVENGLCNRVRRGRSYPRLDGWDRGRYLEANLRALAGALDAGLPVGAYYHWSLMDNYEWGSYEPRFGIFGIDRERGVRVLGTDAMGHDAAGAYRKLIEAMRAGDRSLLAAR
ncbi:MAG: glycoside hydrolase family 1 protein [Actinobacteria bacterium]|nr:glycoside hydrolase family 1 protein [Actinomycetota bacterium]